MTLPGSIFPHFGVNTRMPEPRSRRDWTLADAIAESRHAIHARFTPDMINGRGILMPTPLEPADADELYRRLAAHFTAWTGKDLVRPDAPCPLDGPSLATRCTAIADQVVPEFRANGLPCTGLAGKRWQAAWDGACLALGGDPAAFLNHVGD